jgi:glutamine amidotransferase
MMGMVGKTPSADVLQEFRGMAVQGNILPGATTCGHGDGWGFAGYANGALAYFHKSELSAVDDPAYHIAADEIASMQFNILLGHFRKASVGDLTVENAHPFRHGIYSFCHNGGVRESEKIPLGGLKPEGETDSERYFLNIMSRLESGEARTMKDALAQTVHMIHASHKYSSICCLLTDGHSMLAYRDFRRAHSPDETLPSDWDAYPTYYTLYLSKDALTVASEPMPDLAKDWQLMDNGQLIEIRPDGSITCDMLK